MCYLVVVLHDAVHHGDTAEGLEVTILRVSVVDACPSVSAARPLT